MKAKELQSDDYLSYKGQIIIKVESITKKKVGYHIKPNECHMHYVRLRECKPIPLIKIHLTKNGFVATNESDTEFVYGDGGYEVRVEFDEGLPEANIEPSIFLKIEFAEKELVMPIEYLHELQHAMRLFGIEKEIEL